MAMRPKDGASSRVEVLVEPANTPVDPLLPLVIPAASSRTAGLPELKIERVRREQLGLLLRSWNLRVGAVILLIWVLCALLGNLVRPFDPLKQDLLTINQPPSGAHLFGTDNLGRDMFSRVLVGAREVMIVAPLATILATILGSVLGLLQGFLRGPFDAITSRFVEAFLALPSIIVVFLFVVAVGPSKLSLIVVIGFTFGLAISRTVRTAVLQERQLDYIAAAQLRGESSLHTMSVEVLPNITSPITVEFTIRLGYAINAAATLSFLGFGVQPPTPDWGADISANAQYLSAGFWWATVFPALAIASLITSVSLIGDAVESSTQ